MPEPLQKPAAIIEIRNKIRSLHLLLFFVVFSLLFVIIRYLYPPLSRFFDFLPDASIVLIICLAVCLALIGLYFSKVFTGQIVKSVEDFSTRLNNLLNITKELRGETHSDILLEKVLECSLAIVRAEAGAILIEEGGPLVFKTVRGTLRQGSVGGTVPRDAGIRGWVYKEGQAVMINDLGQDARVRDGEFGDNPPSSLLCIPLKTRSGTIGLIEILGRQCGSFHEKDREVVSYLADQAAVAIEKARFSEDQKNYEIHLTDILLDAMDRILSEKEGHAHRVANYASIIAKALSLPEDQRRRLYFAGLLHDIGFLRLPPDKSYEKETFSLHPSVGYEMLQPITFYRDIAPLVLYHHERIDGYGYPGGLKGEAIPLASRIIAIAEAFDTMTGESSYKVPMSFEAAIDELLKHRGSQFDPELVDFFVRDIRETID